jgi:hypothetical protein
VSCWSARDLSDAAAICGATPRHIRAVAAVEAPRGPFDDAGEPAMLFERHLFHRHTAGRFDGVAPDLSNATPGGYGKYSDQPKRLARARALNEAAALKATSFGAFQILASNHVAAGFPTPQDFEQAMRESPRQHLLAFARFLVAERIAQHLLAEDWTAFARRYNGVAYAKHGYHTRLAAAWAKAAA